MKASSVALREQKVDETLARAVLSENWEYAESDTQQLTHNIHRYSGKFIPQIAHRAIDLLTKPGEIVLDPYCGSGTVLVEAAVLNRLALGIDLNPLAILIASAKIKPLSEVSLAHLKARMEACVRRLDPEASLPLFSGGAQADTMGLNGETDARLADEWYCKWFRNEVLCDLVSIKNELEKIEGSV
jgi:hypothetical protein